MDALTAFVLLLLAPPVTAADLDRFPSWEATQEAMRSNRACLERLGELKRFSPHRSVELDVARAAVERRFWLWGNLVAAQSNVGFPGREYWLERLRGEIGPYDYALGRMPPVVPPELFELID